MFFTILLFLRILFRDIVKFYLKIFILIFLWEKEINCTNKIFVIFLIYGLRGLGFFMKYFLLTFLVQKIILTKKILWRISRIFSFWKNYLSRNKLFVAFEKIVNLGLGKSENFIFEIIELIFWKEIKPCEPWSKKEIFELNFW